MILYLVALIIFLALYGPRERRRVDAWEPPVLTMPSEPDPDERYVQLHRERAVLGAYLGKRESAEQSCMIILAHRPGDAQALRLIERIGRGEATP